MLYLSSHRSLDLLSRDADPVSNIRNLTAPILYWFYLSFREKKKKNEIHPLSHMLAITAVPWNLF